MVDLLAAAVGLFAFEPTQQIDISAQSFAQDAQRMADEAWRNTLHQFNIAGAAVCGPHEQERG